jgi:aminopeptidase-like protein
LKLSFEKILELHVTRVKGEQITDLNGFESTGYLIYMLLARLFPICRSTTGKGVRESLDMISEEIPISIKEVPSGTRVFSRSIPKEWNINQAWIKDPSGKKILDFKDHNLHILHNSMPVHQITPLSDLKKRLYSLPEQPDLIPFKISNRENDWGFCLSHRQLQNLQDGKYEVFIDSSFQQGYLNYGELYIPGESKEEILFSTDICSPSLANDNASGMALTTFLAKSLSQRQNHYSYRFLFLPGMIGAITWLALNEDKLGLIRNGLMIYSVGDHGNFSYKRSREGNNEIDRVVEYVLSQSGHPHSLSDFSPEGYGERLFCSPAYNLPIGTLTRSLPRQYPEYHTSGDNLDFVTPDCLDASFYIYERISEILEMNHTYLNSTPKCEPYIEGLDTLDDSSDFHEIKMAVLWVLNFSDGKNDLLTIAKKSGYSFDVIQKAAQILEHNKLIKNTS